MLNAKPSLFLTPLSLGGKLTVVNANFWVIFVLLARGNLLSRDLPYGIAYPGEVLIVVMSLPLVCLVPTITGPTGIWAILPTIGLPGVWGLLVAVVILGSNAFLWGYGLAWIIERIGVLFAKSRG
jgi:hypothetical protein